MGKKKNISTEKRAQIVILKQTGKSYRDIARILQISKSAAQRAVVRFEDTGSNIDRKRPGQPRKTSKKIDDKLYNISNANRFKSASDIRAEINERLDAPISLSTVKSRLRDKGMIGRVAIKKPLLRPINKQKRVKFAREHISWTINQWKTVLWTDESKFELFGSHRRQYCRRKVNERLNPKCIAPNVKHGGGSVMVWGCFSFSGAGSLFKIDGILNKEQYHSILQRHAIPSGLKLIGPGFIFQQDNDPKHTSGLCTKYLQKKQNENILQIMDWPPQSPDLNPIELLWDELDRRVKDLHPTSIPTLWNCLSQTWRNIPTQTMQKLVERMPKLCAAVIKAKGDHIQENRLK